MKLNELKFAQGLAELGGGGCVSTPDGMLHKRINGEWIAKPGVQLKSYRTVWFEEITNLDDIDDTCFNRDGSRKTEAI